jgi:predicted DNA-binding protein (UPF0251 family)
MPHHNFYLGGLFAKPFFTMRLFKMLSLVQKEAAKRTDESSETHQNSLKFQARFSRGDFSHELVDCVAITGERIVQTISGEKGA